MRLRARAALLAALAASVAAAPRAHAQRLFSTDSVLTATIAAMPNASGRLYLRSTTIPAMTTGRITMLCTVPCFHPFFLWVSV